MEAGLLWLLPPPPGFLQSGGLKPTLQWHWPTLLHTCTQANFNALVNYKYSESTDLRRTQAELLNDFCNAIAMQLWSDHLSPLSTFSIIQWIRISDFGLLDPDGDPDCHQNLIIWSPCHALPLQEISSKSFYNFFSYPTDRQTDRQTNRPK